MAMEPSILISTKKILGIEASYKAFDLDIMTHINSVFNTLHGLGIGPSTGFMIEDDIVSWEEFLPDEMMLHNSIKTYVYLRVRLLFDPPATSYHIAAINEQIKELEYRLSIQREGVSWTEPVQPVSPTEPIW